MKKLAFAVMAAAMVMFGLAAPAGAQTDPYGSDGTVVTVTPPSSPAGGTITVEVTGCEPGSSVVVAFDGSTTTVTVDASGSAVITLTAPTTAGTYPGTATCGTEVASFSAVVTAPVTPLGGLPATGSGGVSTTTGIALGLLAVGFGLFGVTQIRRRQTVNA